MKKVEVEKKVGVEEKTKEVEVEGGRFLTKRGQVNCKRVMINCESFKGSQDIRALLRQGGLSRW